MALTSSNSYQDRSEPTLWVKANATHRGRDEASKLEGFVLMRFDGNSISTLQNIALLELDVDCKLVKLAIDAVKGYHHIAALTSNTADESKSIETKIVFKSAAKVLLQACRSGTRCCLRNANNEWPS